jgi:phosphatidylserine/phosphatidylglycerophosphate/cardiolipin synthase-like enzyme
MALRILTDEAAAAVRQVIDARGAELLALPGVLGIEPGFPVVGGKLVREPAVLVYVQRKRAMESLLPEDRVPSELGGYRVDVVEADPWTQVRLDPRTQTLAADIESAALSGLRYEGLPGDPIDAVFEVEKPILCHAGPDTGWGILRGFLEKTEAKLTVAMYDFSADYISASLIANARDKGTRIALTLDDGVAAPEATIQEQIHDQLGAGYQTAIIRCGADMRFPSAYHPKVAVQDNKRFWLSSGNWSPRSQPPIDPIGDPSSAKGMFSRGNREWHVIVEDAPLAELFQRYILHDKEEAQEDAALGAGEANRLPDLFVPLDALMAEAAEAALAVPVPVAPKALPGPPKKVRVRPLLSPDNYALRVSEWLKTAQTRLYLQYSYITYSERPVDRRFRELLDHLAELSWKPGFDLKIIVGSSNAEAVRLLAQKGFNEASIRVQSGIHNKGVVLDDKAVLVSSQNWSGDGFLRNRDAGLIIEDAQIAAYFRDIFLDDWALRARDPFAGAGLSAVIAPEGAPTPPGMARISWRDFFGE